MRVSSQMHTKASTSSTATARNQAGEDVAEPGDGPEESEETRRDEVERDREGQEQDHAADGPPPVGSAADGWRVGHTAGGRAHLGSRCIGPGVVRRGLHCAPKLTDAFPDPLT